MKVVSTPSDFTPSGVRARAPVELRPGRDYTAEILAFLRSVHGQVRQDEHGDYYYATVSAISLHFLLGSRLPAKETLWGWYDYFDRECSESIYQTLPPLRDEAFLRILEGCPFRWDLAAVRESGLVFLSHHRKTVYGAIEEFLTGRLAQHRAMEDGELRAKLTPRNTWSEEHLRRQLRRLKTRPLASEERASIYRRFDSDYLRATARALMDEATTEAFWKQPPPELEALGARFEVLLHHLQEESIRLGVYLSREAYEAAGWRAGREGPRRGRRKAGTGRRNGAVHETGASLVECFATLGLAPTASLVEVKAAYRDQVKRHHPDRGGDVQTFLRLQEAYQVLLSEVY